MKKIFPRPVHLPVLVMYLAFAWLAVICAACALAPNNGGNLQPTPWQASPAESPQGVTPESARVPGKDEIPFKTLAQGFTLSSTHQAPGLQIASSVEGLDVLAALVTTEQKALLADADLEKQVVLAAFWGAKPYGGFSITIDKVLVTGKNLTVNVILSENDPNLPKVEAVTYPYHLVIINRSLLPGEMDFQYRLMDGKAVLAEGGLP